MVTFLEENFLSVFFPHCSRGLEGDGWGWGSREGYKEKLSLTIYILNYIVN